MPLSTMGGDDGPQIARSVSLARAAELLGVSRRTIYYRIQDGRLQTIRTRGGSQRVLVESLTLMGSFRDIILDTIRTP